METTTPDRVCPECGRLIPSPQIKCPHCGYIAPPDIDSLLAEGRISQADYDEELRRREEETRKR